MRGGSSPLTRTLSRHLLPALVCLALPAGSLAFDINEEAPVKWPGARTTIFSSGPSMSDTSATGITFQEALTEASRHWSLETPFRFDVSPQFRDPCSGRGPDASPGQRAGDGFNGQGFAGSVCGDDFNGSALAATVQVFQANALGTFDMLEADVVYNANHSFDIYDGPLPSDNSQFAGFDFRRVALHELGHVLGLGHESEVPAIMAPSSGDLFRLQDDDIAGVEALYAGISNCPFRTGGFGRFDGMLEDGDCRVSTLVSGGSDDSPVDVFTLSLAEEITLDLRMTAAPLDGVLLLTSEDLEVQSMDADSGGFCNPRIHQTVPAGDYVLLVNTWDVAEGDSPPCGESVRGDYRLSVSYESDRLLTLQGQESFRGGEVDAAFFGAVTVDDGASFRNRVRSDESFDVEGRIRVDPAHRGEPGFIVVAAVIDTGETLVKNGNGDFVIYRPALQRVPVAERRQFSSNDIEAIDVMNDVVAQDLGIHDIEVNFFIGYGVDSDPDELFFHSQPINLIVE